MSFSELRGFSGTNMRGATSRWRWRVCWRGILEEWTPGRAALRKALKLRSRTAGGDRGSDSDSWRLVCLAGVSVSTLVLQRRKCATVALRIEGSGIAGEVSWLLSGAATRWQSITHSDCPTLGEKYCSCESPTSLNEDCVNIVGRRCGA